MKIMMMYVDRYIALDCVTTEFLKNLKAIRKSRGLTQQELATLCDIDKSSIACYEQGKRLPLVHRLMLLAEVLRVDLSESINYSYYFGRIRIYGIMRRMERYGLTYRELERVLNYDDWQVKRAVTLKTGVSLDCLRKVLEVLDEERKKEKSRTSLLKEKEYPKA